MPFELSDSSVQFAAVERVYRLKYDTTINVKHFHFLCKVITPMQWNFRESLKLWRICFLFTGNYLLVAWVGKQQIVSFIFCYIVKYPQYNLMNDVLICLAVWTCAIIPPDFTSSAVMSPHRIECHCKFFLSSWHRFILWSSQNPR